MIINCWFVSWSMFASWLQLTWVILIVWKLNKLSNLTEINKYWTQNHWSGCQNMAMRRSQGQITWGKFEGIWKLSWWLEIFHCSEGYILILFIVNTWMEIFISLNFTAGSAHAASVLLPSLVCATRQCLAPYLLHGKNTCDFTFN